MLAEAVGIGIVISLLLTETVGLAAGGIVVPGYIAYNLHNFAHVIGTMLVAIITWLIVKLLQEIMLIYGRRLLVMSILVGYILGHISKLFPPIELGRALLDLSAIGYVIPGLIAYWIERQGVYRTFTTMIVAAVLVRLILAALSGGKVIP
jgi:poly-gamma-glutamate biosynthesis protein PgsC/CapC